MLIKIFSPPSLTKIIFKKKEAWFKIFRVLFSTWGFSYFCSPFISPRLEAWKGRSSWTKRKKCNLTAFYFCTTPWMRPRKEDLLKNTRQKYLISIILCHGSKEECKKLGQKRIGKHGKLKDREKKSEEQRSLHLSTAGAPRGGGGGAASPALGSERNPRGGVAVSHLLCRAPIPGPARDAGSARTDTSGLGARPREGREGRRAARRRGGKRGKSRGRHRAAHLPLEPHFSFSFFTCSRLSPVLSLTPKYAKTSSTVFVCAFSMVGAGSGKWSLASSSSSAAECPLLSPSLSPPPPPCYHHRPPQTQSRLHSFQRKQN